MSPLFQGEHQHMTETRTRDHGFIVGLVTGTVVGAGLAMWFAPRMAAEIRERLTDSAQALNDRAADGLQHATTRVRDTVDDITKRGRDVRDGLADAVARGAREVERMATSVKA
jgi:gas vesicle protein